MNPQILVVGAGSIGTRHARNLTALGADVTVMDPDRGRAEAVAVGRAAALDLHAASAHDAVVIASPTIHHAEQLATVLARCPHVFVEKPMVHGVDELQVVHGHEHQVMVGFNLRFHRPIAHAHELMAAGVVGSPVAARFWFGSWLPDWRPDIDYRSTYSARAELGGGVLMDAIHEIDLAIWFLGSELEVAGALVERLGPLEIDVEDTVRALLVTTARVPVEISLDLISRRYRRGLEIVGTEATIRFDWDRAQLEVDRPSERDVIVADAPVARSYVDQAKRLVEWISEGTAPPVDGHGGAASVRVAHAIRERAWLPTP